MNLFSGELANISFADIEEFLAIKAPEEQRPTEGVRIDYKLKEPSDFPETVAAFANTYGGLLLIGVESNKKKNNAPIALLGEVFVGGDIKARITGKILSQVTPRPDISVGVWFQIPVMRRIAITTPNVMAKLRRLNRDLARPYNFALSPVIVNLSDSRITLLGTFEKDAARWGAMPYINIHDGEMHTLQPPTLLVLPQTFDMVFAQYIRHPEHKSLAPDSNTCKACSRGLLKRYPVTASEFHIIGKETEPGWGQAEDISTLLPSLVRYGRNSSTAKHALRDRLQQISLDTLQKETGLSRHTILRVRRGERVHPRSLQRLRIAACTVPTQKS